LSKGRPHLPPPGKLEVGEDGDAPLVSEQAKSEAPNPGNVPHPDAIPQSPRDPAGIELSESQPQAEQSKVDVAPKGMEKFLKPAGTVVAGLLAVGTLGGIIWAFNKWKNRGLKKEAKKGGKGKKERRHVREWTVFEE
jgi:hypothetical protein